MNRREFNAAALAAVLGPYLRIPGDYPYADYGAFEEWLDGIMDDANAKSPLVNDIELDALQKIGLYVAITDWLASQESPA